MLDLEMINVLKHGVPAAMGIALLFFAVTVVRALMKGIADSVVLARAYRLASTTGRTVQGSVVRSVERRTALKGGFERRMVETIAFTAQSGQEVQGEPRLSDVGMEDRIGQSVTVRYDEQDPARFLAPTDAATMLWGVHARAAGKQLAFGLLGLLIVAWAVRLFLATF